MEQAWLVTLCRFRGAARRRLPVQPTEPTSRIHDVDSARREHDVLKALRLDHLVGCVLMQTRVIQGGIHRKSGPPPAEPHCCNMRPSSLPMQRVVATADRTTLVLGAGRLPPLRLPVLGAPDRLLVYS